MKLIKIRGGSQEDLDNKGYNINIGISLGNKWFTAESIVELIEWTLPRTREFVGVCPADEIHAINLQVRNEITSTRALKIVKRRGAELLAEVQQLVETRLSAEDRAKIKYTTWADVVDSAYIQKREYLYSLYRDSADFKAAIHELVKAFVSQEQREFSENEIDQLGTYLIEELPEILCRVPIGGVIYDAYVYPFDSRVTEFAEKVQKGEIFPEIKERLLGSALPKVFLEVNDGESGR